MAGIIDRVKSYGIGDMLKSGVDSYVLFSLIRRIAKPFKEWQAYKLGVIDDKGNILISKDKRTPEQYKSLTYFDIFVMNFKKMLQKIPGGNNKYLTYAAALYLLKEDKYLEYDLLTEDGEPIANSSSGIASSSSNEANAFKGTPKDFYKKKRIDILKRNANLG